MNKKVLLGGILGIVAMLGTAGYYGLIHNGSGTTPRTYTNTPVTQNDTEVTLAVDTLSKTAKFFSYDSNGVTIKYFAMKDLQGTVHVAFDACDVCYQAKKGYTQVSDVMQCLNCGRQFAVTSIGSENTNGGCWPSFLPMTNNEASVIIKIADLEEKAYMF